MKRHRTASAADTSDAHTNNADFHGGVLHIPRSRGAVSGMLLIILGAWAALIPFIGPLFDYAYTPNKAWHWTAARGWLEVLPGVVAVVCGVVLIMTANRLTASTAGWLALAAGAWLVIGRDVASWWHIGSPGQPAGAHAPLRALEALGMFSGVGAFIIFVAAGAIGRLSIRSVRDVRAAQRHERKAEARQRGVGDAAYQAGRRDEAAERERAAQAAERERAAQAAERERAAQVAGPPPGYPSADQPPAAATPTRDEGLRS